MDITSIIFVFIFLFRVEVGHGYLSNIYTSLVSNTNIWYEMDADHVGHEYFLGYGTKAITIYSILVVVIYPIHGPKF